ncbi:MULTISPECIES: hypothetical protein [Deefgea]|uniref:DinB family protein n=1 Tax=Deefgea chitinilytica TaxID=570276 RepID=A0ABS2C9X5_9NEIS|nr:MULTISPECIES: hypothetical protein [Deefgea]MBM5570956.1 DinB family protein [Deefgea chitinilytica]MBM9888186.1 DinB family protein [Deefgea sp. CFH1-16]
MLLKEWSAQLQQLRELIKDPAQHLQAIECAQVLHAQVFTSEMSGNVELTFEDQLWNGLTDWAARHGVNSKGRTVVYGIWHCTRIEDITMNLLLADAPQVFHVGSWGQRMNFSLANTGNQLSSAEILQMSDDIDLVQLREYRQAVGRNTQQIISRLPLGSLKQKIPANKIERLRQEKTVSTDPSASWLIEYWSSKTVGGLLLMPATRHHVIHLNESVAAKKEGLRREKALAKSI